MKEICRSSMSVYSGLVTMFENFLLCCPKSCDLLFSNQRIVCCHVTMTSSSYQEYVQAQVHALLLVFAMSVRKKNFETCNVGMA